MGIKKQCKCTMAERLVGDGCEVCNPALALEYAKQTIADLEAELELALSCLNEDQLDEMEAKRLDTAL